MADGRRVRTKPYPRVAILLETVIGEKEWSQFDGWCAARNVEPLKLPFHRFINLVYFHITRGRDEKGRKAVDDAISNAIRSWKREQASAALQASRSTMVRTRRRVDIAIGSSVDPVTRSTETQPNPWGRKRNLPPKPAGWGDGGSASSAAGRTILRQLRGK